MSELGSDPELEAHMARLDALYVEEEKMLTEYMWDRDLPIDLAFEKEWAGVTLRFLAEYVVDDREARSKAPTP